MSLSVVPCPEPKDSVVSFGLDKSQETEEFSLMDDPESETNYFGIVGQSSALRQVLQLVDMVAASDATVLLLG